jgi:uncharacterized membrane protein YidH (DUF202 family)
MVLLEHRSAPNAPWESACEGSCDRRLPIADEYRVIGTGINGSRPFNLDGTKGDKVVLKVVAGEHKRENIGKYILIGGGALIVAGIVVIAVGSHPSQTFQADGTTNNTNFDVLTAGTALILGGLVGGVYGGATWYNNRHSHVGGDVQGVGPARDPHATRDEDASIVRPELTATGMRTPAPVAPMFQIPLLNRSF